VKNFNHLPLVGVRNNLPPEPRVAGGYEQSGGYQLEAKKKAHKFDHAQMLRDRIAGMSWAAIAAKHGVRGKRPDHMARQYATNSRAVHTLTPAEAAALDNVSNNHTAP
jgi:hypothetical protein